MYQKAIFSTDAATRTQHVAQVSYTEVYVAGAILPRFSENRLDGIGISTSSMFHCGGGPGCGNVDWLSAAVNWVEKGIAPALLVGAHNEGSKTTRTRPICAYPNVAHYKGSGSIDAAENFVCGSPGI